MVDIVLCGSFQILLLRFLSYSKEKTSFLGSARIFTSVVSMVRGGLYPSGEGLVPLHAPIRR